MSTNMIRFILYILVGLLYSTLSFGQYSDVIELEWTSVSRTINGEFIDVPYIKGQGFNGYRPNFYWKKEFKQEVKPSFEVISFEAATSEDLTFINKQNIVVGNLEYELKFSHSGDQGYIVLNLFPYFRNKGGIQRITKVGLSYQSVNSSLNKDLTKDFVANSVLSPGSGDWFKFSVKEDGIYKIGYQFLVDLGIDPSSIDPNHINIFGNGDGLLPELNSAPRTDDLAKNAIDIIGDGDGSFDQGDFILFYGWGPDRWYFDSADGFYRTKHIYSNESYYFLNINASDTPLRIGSLNDAGTPNTFTNTYSYYDIHENDLVSLVNGGQRWYGELFDSQLQRSFTFSIPDIVNTSDVEFDVAIASNTNTTSGTAQTYTVGGLQLYNGPLPAASDYGRSEITMTLSNPSDYIVLTVDITRPSPDVLTYMDRITVNTRRSLILDGDQFNFTDINSVGAGNVTEFSLNNMPADGFVWDVTNRHQPILIKGTQNAAEFLFIQETDSLRYFVASDGQDFMEPEIPSLPSVNYQNLHGLEQADYLIVTPRAFESQAERLANLHRANGLTVHVVDVEEIYNEFSSGIQDAGAIRTFAKMFWDRGEMAPETRPKYLLLFGDGTYDPKNRVPNNNNFIVTYQMLNSENHISAMPADDFFGLLDDSDAIFSTDLVDIGVGRLLISDLDIAREQVDKIEHYMRNGSSLYNTSTTNCSSDNGSTTFGDWRTKYVQIADDEENNYFLNFDVEPQFEYVSDSFPEMNCEKIYLDAYTQVSTAGGERYPDVNEAINNKIERGALVVNYVGHGGEVGVAEERVITVPQIQDWRNIDVLPLFVSATCEFTKFDDPDRVSAGEWASLNPYGAAIALMTTTRSVFFGTNTQIGSEFYKNVFKRDTQFKGRTFGEIIMDTKNAVGGDNKRSFTLIGDPALRIALPELKIVTDSINGMDPAIQMDTINALSKVTIKGHLEDHLGNPLTSFNGVLYPSIFDKPKEQVTLSNDGSSSPERSFYTQTSKVYAGKASVTNGSFEFSCVVPKDIDYAIDFGKISYYAENGVTDAIGYDTMFYIGGINPYGLDDDQGPVIELYLNDESFVDGGITDETPILLAKVFDENGINTVGNGIGHDITAILDEETSDPIVLNDFYTADLDSYQSGEIRYNFSELEPGEHTLSLKVWDVNNNSSEASIRFVVQESVDLKLDHVLNYPNPFTDYTEFYFEHNQACNTMEVQLQIFTVSGRLVKTINRYVQTEGFRSEGIEWDGRDEFGDQLAKGVYVYRIKATTPDGLKGEELQKLVILK